MNTSRCIYIFLHGRFPSEKAAALFAAEEARAFLRHAAVTIVAPRRLGRIPRDAHEYYRLPQGVRIVYLPTIDLFRVPLLSFIAFRLSLFTFSISSLLYLLVKAKESDILYSNESLPLYFASFFFPNTVYAVHDFPEKSLYFYHIFLKRMRHILATNRWKAQELVKRFHLASQKVFVEQNAVALEEFSIETSKKEARATLGLPQNVPIAVYTGLLYEWKGVDTLAKAAALVPDALCVFVGGTKKDVAAFSARYEHIPSVRLVGHVPYRQLPLWQRAADVLVLPNSGKEMISSHYTSPMKLFGYMASGRPIVAARLPSIQEVLPEDAGFFFAPDDEQSLAEALEKAFAAGADRAAIKAREVVATHSWEERAKRIFEVISTS